MDNYKLKLKIGEHEFEAEGPTEIVQAQFAAFRELIQSIQQAPVRISPPPAELTINGTQPVVIAKNSEFMLDKIMRTEGRVVSLTARGSSLEDEILLVLLGQRNLRSNDSVSGGEILDGLRLTGRQVVRIDYQLDKMTTAGDVITVGNFRARRSPPY